MSKFEKKAYDNIKLNESVLSTFAKMLFAPKLLRYLKKIDDAGDENWKADTIDLTNNLKNAIQSMERFCKKYPKRCKK